MNRSVLAFTLALALTLVAVGCTPRPGVSTDARLAETEADTAGNESAVAVNSMALEQRKALPQGFPLEIPVIEGEVTFAQGLGSPDVGPWHVEIASPVAPTVAAEWYLQRFTGRSWVIVHEGEQGERLEYVLEKGSGAWATLRISSAEEGSNIEFWAGIGMVAPDGAIPLSAQPGIDV